MTEIHKELIIERERERKGAGYEGTEGQIWTQTNNRRKTATVKGGRGVFECN